MRELSKNSGEKMVEVVAALLWRGDKFLIAKRPKNKARAHLWEFVGGKVEQGEDKASALIRECREELGVTVCPKDIYFEVTHVYPDLTVHLTLFSAIIESGEPQRLEHEEIRWITPGEIDEYSFCPADETILQKIKEDFLP